jgi:1-acyl-sn-glycerol-3-phosphate acyltransferase
LSSTPLTVLRSILFVPVFYINTALFVVLGSFLLFGPRRYAMMGLKAHAIVTLWLLKIIVGTRMEVRGRDKLPRPPYLVASKHQSAWDTFALIPIFTDPALVMKAELRHIPFYGWFSRKFEHIFVERSRGPAALRKLERDAQNRAAAGREVLIFPEGTRRAPGAQPDYKSGAVALYEELKLPCIPWHSTPASTGHGASSCAIPERSSWRSSIQSRPACRAMRSAPSCKRALRRRPTG